MYEFVDSADEVEGFLLAGVSKGRGGCPGSGSGSVRTIAFASLAAAVSAMRARGRLRADQRCS